MAVSSFGEIRFPQKTLKPECLHVESMAIISSVIFPLERSILSTLCRKMASSFFKLQGRGDTEHALVAVETAVRHQNVGVRIKSEEIAEGLHGDDGAGDGIIFGDRLLEKDLQGFPGTAAEITALALSPKSPSCSSFKHAVSFIRCGCLARCSTAKCSKNSNDSSNKASTAAGKLPANCQRKQAGTHFTPYRVRSVSVSFLQNRVHVRRRIAAQNPLAG